MATPLEPSDSLGSEESLENELMRIYTNEKQHTAVMVKWINAKVAVAAMQDQPAHASARAKWEAGCRVIGKMKDDYESVCSMLEGLTAEIESMSVQRKRKTRKATPAATIHGHEESACVFHQTLERPSSDQHLHLQPSGASSAGLETDTDPSSANSSGLKQARDKKRTTSEVRDRRAHLLDHLVGKASDGLPLCVRDLYDSYRTAIGATTKQMPSTKMKLVLDDICNHASGVEYLIFKKPNEEAELHFTPRKRRPDQPPQTLEGKVPVGDRILHYYKNSIPRNYGVLAKRKLEHSSLDDSEVDYPPAKRKLSIPHSMIAKSINLKLSSRKIVSRSVFAVSPPVTLGSLPQVPAEIIVGVVEFPSSVAQVKTAEIPLCVYLEIHPPLPMGWRLPVLI
jgi:hypothetical protein